MTSGGGLGLPIPSALALQTGIIGSEIFGSGIAQVLGHAGHHGVLPQTSPVCHDGIGEIGLILAGKAWYGGDFADPRLSVASCAIASNCFSGRRIAWPGSRRQGPDENPGRVDIVASFALLVFGVRGDHDLFLLKRPPRHLLVAEGAQFYGIAWVLELQLVRAIRAGSRDIGEWGFIPTARNAVTDLAFDD
ncbi:MAG: hypothetical protein AAB319_08500, partial [Pseudomonadota bacterium]